ncbi:SOS response-associated peptidase [Calidifontibacillus erzurumensis]|uniref:Abasic site processing protein n=1 Tax=Calidifontibacillus erzurumensis TaxID=2741433 RepID=A0A8J8GEU7_9BACI|nr:SOS response-associated peptidase [Calidifontibacillus erzurumensis]NSL50518.1 SOS response-associated peptidase [Calidifontibacillus erzurumensis]
MCGRFSLTVPLEEIIEFFDLINGDELDYEISYNIAPSQNVLSIVSDGTHNRGGYLRWGLVPFWADSPAIGYKMINARAETIDQKASFKNLIKRRRCLIVADGFYEWKKDEKGNKRPYRMIRKNNGLMAFAGLWDRWEKGGTILHTCTIITTRPNELMAEIHDRMPVILPEEKQKIWLDRTIEDVQFLKDLLQPYPTEDMIAYEVSSIVNSPKNNQEECIQPLV